MEIISFDENSSWKSSTFYRKCYESILVFSMHIFNLWSKHDGGKPLGMELLDDFLWLVRPCKEVKVCVLFLMLEFLMVLFWIAIDICVCVCVCVCLAYDDDGFSCYEECTGIVDSWIFIDWCYDWGFPAIY